MIEFTQYLKPDGRRSRIEIPRPEEIEAMAEDLLESGFVFEAEVLNDDRTISLTVSDPFKEEDVAIVVVENGPKVPAAVDELVRDAHRKWMAGEI